MKIALLDARQGNRDPANSSTVAYRNMLTLAKDLNADLYVSALQLKPAPSDYDAIICGFGSTSTEREQSTDFLIRNKKAELFWLVGEYEQSTFAPLFYAKRPYQVIKNYEHKMKSSKATKQHFVNINALLAKPNKMQNKPSSHGAIYYGRWREDRSVYFRRYLNNGVMLSTSPKNMKVFAAHGCSPKYARAMSWEEGRETLRLFACSLYIEDVFTHTHYNCPANRYYEALFCGVPIVFQPESIATFRKYGISIPDWRIVKNGIELANLANQIIRSKDLLEEALAEQSEWSIIAQSERAAVITEIKTILTG